jgi:cobalt-zinc-cadmium efflux system membrane fusion protein
MSAELSVVVGGDAAVLTVPAAAVLTIAGKPLVFVETPEGFVPVEVQTGIGSDNVVHVTRGLRAGDRVVLDGKRQLYGKLHAGPSATPRRDKD